jgi:hypothetical protein
MALMVLVYGLPVHLQALSWQAWDHISCDAGISQLGSSSSSKPFQLRTGHICALGPAVAGFALDSVAHKSAPPLKRGLPNGISKCKPGRLLARGATLQPIHCEEAGRRYLQLLDTSPSHKLCGVLLVRQEGKKCSAAESSGKKSQPS